MNEPPSTTSSAQHRTWLAELSSGIAVTLSIVALGLGVYQTRIQQAEAHASVWPYLAINRSYFDSGEHQGFNLEVANHGVGPAKVESIVIRVDGKPVTTWDGVLQLLLGKTRANTGNVTFSTLGRFVLPPDSNRDTAKTMLHLYAPDDARAMDQAARRLDIEACYCSVYEQCWIARSAGQPLETDRCDAPNDIRFSD
jgi:hypothetical protein